MKVSARNLRSLLQALSSVGMGTASLLCGCFLSALSLFLSLSSCAWIGLSTLSICPSPPGGKVDLNTRVWTPGEVLPPSPCPEPASPGTVARFSKLGNQRAYLKDIEKIRDYFQSFVSPLVRSFSSRGLEHSYHNGIDGIALVWVMDSSLLLVITPLAEHPEAPVDGPGSPCVQEDSPCPHQEHGETGQQRRVKNSTQCGASYNQGKVARCLQQGSPESQCKAVIHENSTMLLEKRRNLRKAKL